MKPAFIILALIAMLCAGFLLVPKTSADEPKLQLGSVRTGEQAVAVFSRYFREHGGDPAAEEITANWQKDRWVVVAWHISNPQATGSGRFMPDGYILYTVSTDGNVTNVIGAPFQSQGASSPPNHALQRTEAGGRPSPVGQP